MNSTSCHQRASSRVVFLLLLVRTFVTVCRAFTPPTVPVPIFGHLWMGTSFRVIKMKTNMAATVVPFDHDDAEDPSAKMFAKKNYTLVYSNNFHRHVVWSNTINSIHNNGTSTREVVQSFAFIDEALEQYPTAQRLPVIHRHPAAAEPCLTIAGSGLLEQEAYPPPSLSSSSSQEENVQQIKSYLETKLKCKSYFKLAHY
jgi:hypothetical protein